jgi:glutamyl-Q tRNA(Asp) synthetase
LHFGSLVAALASFCQARSQQGRWLLRIEDVDTPRVVSGAADQILRDLEAFGFSWDGPVLYQSDQFERYRYYLEKLLAEGSAFACECSRRSLREQGVDSGPLGQIYPANCRHKNLSPEGHSIRLNTESATSVAFVDQVYGRFEMNLPATVGDFVLRRAKWYAAPICWKIPVCISCCSNGSGFPARATCMSRWSTTPSG